MEIEVTNIKDISVVHVNGFMDASTSPIVEEEVLKLIEEGKTKLLLNLKDVSYMSSSGLRVFLSASKSIKAVKGKFIVCEANEVVQEILKISGFDLIIEVQEKYEEAILSF
ncbi:STAS domain-containing protein [Flammeovirga aprica]|uniref:Anti-sigma factor antagonist n=1 Tax=Flammeovirga aprica JL-4 TaxID=694437 RepID=A0A7X9XAI6_9BACT|nr:STAS domain-containing protein [Flammeovirga aprica]NME69643.1 STAS domain-containing protein [Flammeovirga aprica JL-4]